MYTYLHSANTFVELHTWPADKLWYLKGICHLLPSVWVSLSPSYHWRNSKTVVYWHTPQQSQEAFNPPISSSSSLFLSPTIFPSSSPPPTLSLPRSLSCSEQAGSITQQPPNNHPSPERGPCQPRQLKQSILSPSPAAATPTHTHTHTHKHTAVCTRSTLGLSVLWPVCGLTAKAQPLLNDQFELSTQVVEWEARCEREREKRGEVRNVIIHETGQELISPWWLVLFRDGEEGTGIGKERHVVPGSLWNKQVTHPLMLNGGIRLVWRDRARVRVRGKMTWNTANRKLASLKCGENGPDTGLFTSAADSS